MFRRSIAAFTVALTFLSSTAVVEAKPVSEIVKISQTTVTRAEFLGWLFDTLDLKLEDECRVQFNRFPRRDKVIVCTAESHNLLGVFGNVRIYSLRRKITRGEALLVVTALQRFHEEADVSAFKDVRTEPMKQAVKNALSLKLMNPQRAANFGVDRPLTGAEAASLLTALQQRLQGGNRPQAIVEQGTSVPKEEILDAVWEILNEHYLHSEKVQGDKPGYGAIEGLIKSLEDPYTVFYRPTEAQSFVQQFEEEFSGIGAHIEDREGIITVVSALKGSPAEAAGLLPGDQILEADGQSLKGIGVDKAVSIIRGPIDTVVKLKVKRGNPEFMLEIKRQKISMPEIKTTWNGGIAILEISQFGETTMNKARTILADVNAQKPNGIIIDLRNNPGGLLDAAVKLVSAFVPKNSLVVKSKGKTEETLDITSEDPVVSPSVGVVVLINKGSASASEIAAGALQDHKRATLIGTQTFGKGTVQQYVTFITGEALKFTQYEWFTPLDRKINGIGVAPDIVEEDKEKQMQRAIQFFR